MKPDNVKQAIIQQLDSLGDKLDGYSILLFGSRASKNAHPRSDFDIGVIGENAMPSHLFYYIEAQFDKIETLYTIDWVDLTQTSASFREEALTQVEVLI